VSWRFILIFFSLPFGFPKEFSPSGVPTKLLYVFVVDFQLRAVNPFWNYMFCVLRRGI
jgi:hypothetical protein